MTVRILVGDVRERLAELPDESVHCVVTSPPYWGLRDYGTARWEGGDPTCDHRMFLGGHGAASAKQVTSAGTQKYQYRSVCGRCGARRVDNQIGLEPTPQEHVARMVGIFREVRRVLRRDGVCWVNYGDSYATSPNGRSAAETKAVGRDDRTFRDKPFGTAVGGLKAKDLCMVPFRFALAMQEDGWWLRSVLPWVKRNAMPESIKDRPATAIEYVFMFTRSERYAYDADAVRQARVSDENAREFRGGSYTQGEPGPRKVVGNKRVKIPGRWDTGAGAHGTIHRGGRTEAQYAEAPERAGRNFRNTDLFFESIAKPHGLLTDVNGEPLALDVAPKPFRGAHFATFPPKLIEPLIKAGCPVGGTVLDPFGGSGTTALVAEQLSRHSVLVELNPEYVEIARRRLGLSDATPTDAPADKQAGHAGFNTRWDDKKALAAAVEAMLA